ncbi:DUF6798 domain-containing protein [Halobacillus halophilus]|uniref:DUF6798 domain-containing protein n=1 Tax=Halobacillus halophilus TaxID=1570 RepID=UPI001CD4CF28|nr:DUF6798 domain-containing protein [Halobacillus halophilus]MCA1010076.1 hypothetical protein [Halobacillus halophilus]
MSKNKTTLKKESDLVFGVTVFLTALFSVYFYQVAWGWPIVDSYPQMERMLDSNYLTNDFYTNTFGDFSARLYIAYFFIFGSEFFQTHYTIFIGYANLLRIFLLTMAVFIFLNTVSKNKYVALIGTFLGAVSFYSVPRMIAWFFSTPVISAAEISLIIIIFSTALIYQNKLSIGFLLLGLSMVIHPVVTIHGVGFAAILYFTKYGLGAYKKLFKVPVLLAFSFMAGTFLLNYIPYKNSLKGSTLLSSSEFTHIIGEVRHPHHYIPSMFGLEIWGLFLFYAATFIYMSFKLKKQLAKSINTFIKYYLIYLSLVLVVGYIFVEVWPIKEVVTIIPYRSLVFFALVYLLLFSQYVFYKFINKDYISFLFLHLPFIPILAQDILVSSTCMIVAFSYAILTDFLASRNIKSSIKIDQYFFNRLNLNYFYLFIITFALASAYFGLGRGIAFNIPNINAKENEVYKWLNENTPEESVVLAELDVDYLVNQKIRLISDRAVPISKDFPFNEKYYSDWNERYIDIYGGKYDNLNYINNMSEAELNDISKEYGVDYYLRTKRLKQSENISLEKIIRVNEENVYIYMRN